MNDNDLIERLRTCPERGRNTIEAAERIEVLLLQRECNKCKKIEVLEKFEPLTNAQHQLPKLPVHPEPHNYTWSELEIEAIREYGLRCVAQERERCISICDDLAESYSNLSEHTLLTTTGKTVHRGMYGGAVNCAIAIKRGTA